MILFNLAILCWAIGATLISVEANPFISLFLWRISCSAVTFISVFFLHTIYLITKSFSKKLLIFAYFQAIFYTYYILFSDQIIGPPMKNIYSGFFTVTVGGMYVFWFISWLIITILAHFLLFKTYLAKKRSNKDLIILFVSYAPGFTCATLNFLNPFNFSIFQIGNLGIALYCLLVTYFIFKEKTLGLEIAYKKGLFYSLLVAILMGIYLLLVMILEWMFKGILGYKSISISLLYAFLIAILFNPIREKVQHIIDKLFLRKSAQEISNENFLLRQEIERADRLKAVSTLALGLAHEIKNPLTTLKTFTEFLPLKYTDENFIKKFSVIIPREVDRINHIVHQLLDFSKPTPPILKSVNICETIEDILNLMSNDFLKRKINLIVQYEDTDLVAKIDVFQIKQVLFNILLNAMDSMNKGGKIFIFTKMAAIERLQIIIKDEGCGIAKENLKNIFDPFFSTKDEGTGLGLAISHQIINNHNGTIEIQSEVKKGSKAIIELPLYKK
ncbi:MAG: ATP-binding protein [Candidatus Omnitrophota bacterium]